MALRPWNVFKTTVYVAKTTGGHVPVISRINRARTQVPFESASEDISFGKVFVAFALPSAVTWMLLCASWWRYSDPERLRAVEAKSGGPVILNVLGWRVTSHLGPPQTPNLARASLHDRLLQSLPDPLLLDSERCHALSRLEQLSQRTLGASSLTGTGGLEVLEPLFLELFSTETADMRWTTSERETCLRILLNVVCATPCEKREVPGWVLSSLVSLRGEPFDSPLQEEVRATLLVLLLDAPANCKLAAELPEVLEYFSQGFKKKEDTLWPLKAYLLSGETTDLVRKGARLIARECPGAIALPQKYDRETPSLQMKYDLRNMWTTTMLTVAWGAFRGWTGVVNVSSVFRMVRFAAGALGGVALLEGLWRAQESMIDAPWYCEESRVMLPCSAAMCGVNCAAWAWAFKRTAAMAPFTFCIFVKDDHSDSYRSFKI
uniref:Uncharacterized protein n=1 Tax=Noctiluca scintillans TaxID=2966 RepID=A0A7S1FCY5_NOCSC|mmetsp:Transcript_5073/g.14081  ORF Transcript_5073/g.14081 Transcript_5073/m.14081 type:complete len:434 (+) Transcript_5073:92-1393(+)